MVTKARAPYRRLSSVARTSAVHRVVSAAQAHPVWAIFMLALAARAVVAVGVAIAHAYNVAPDGLVYGSLASNAATGHTAGWGWYEHNVWDQDAGFLRPLTGLYEVFGAHRLVGQLYVAVLGAGTAAFTTLLALEVLPRRWALASGVIVALLPTQIIWSSLILKDAAVWFALSGLALTIALAGRARGFRLLMLGVAAVALLVLLGYLRQQTLAIATWALILASLVGPRFNRVPRIGGAIAIGVLIPWIVFSMGPAAVTFIRHSRAPTNIRAWNSVGANSVIPSGVQILRRPSGSGTSRPRRQVVAPSKVTQAEVTPASVASQNEVRQDLTHLPQGLLAMLVQPYPWHSASSTSLNIARGDAVIWYPFLLLAFVGLLTIRPRHLRVMAFPLLAGGAILLAYALTEGNLGTAFRHRGECEWVLAVLAGFGLLKLAAWRSQGRGSFSVRGSRA